MIKIYKVYENAMNSKALLLLLSCWDSPGKNTGVGCHFLLQ